MAAAHPETGWTFRWQALPWLLLGLFLALPLPSCGGGASAPAGGPASGPPHILSFAASPGRVMLGQSATLTWDTSGATTLSVDQGVGALAASSGSRALTPTQPVTWTLSAGNGSGTVTATTSVGVDCAVTFANGAGGSLQGNTSQTVPYGGDAAAVTAVPDTGYRFTGWSGPGFAGSTANPLVITGLTTNLSLSASFVLQSFTLDFAAGSGGSLQGSVHQTVAYGQDATAVRAVPDPGFGFLAWSGAGFPGSTANPLTVTDVRSDLQVSASFGALQTLQFVAGSGGTLTGSATQSVPAGGTSSAVTAVPNAGWAFTGWTGSSGFTATNANPLIITPVAAGMILTAHFARVPVIGGFSAAATTIGKGQAAVLTWSGLAYYDTASIDNGVGALASPNGTVGPYPNATTTYTLNANCTDTATGTMLTTTRSVTVTVVPAPTISSFTATPVAVDLGGTSTLAWSVTGAQSLSIDNGVGAVTGGSVDVVPPAGTTTYKLTANNGYGTTASRAVTVTSGLPATLTYGASPITAYAGQALAPAAPAWTGGAPTSYLVSPALPSGISLDPATGVISGTPGALAALASYTVRGSNAYGYAQCTVQLQVIQNPPSIAYAGDTWTFVAGTAITPLAPTNSGGAASSWTISQTLPQGLSFDTATGRISGTPSAVSPSGTYVVTATNSGGGSSATLTIQVVAPGPVISAQPQGQILRLGDLPQLSVTASGAGALSYQWRKDGADIGGATGSSYAAPAFGAGDDGAVYSVVVTDSAGSAVSDGARLSLYQDLAAWLLAHPSVASAIRWQFRAADLSNVYVPPGDGDKVDWASWSAAQKADLDQAYQDAVAWFNAGAQQVSMVPGGTATVLTDQPTNMHSQVSVDTLSTMVQVTPAYMWRLYTGHVAFSLMLECHRQLPWTVTDYDAASLRQLYDSSAMGWLLPNGNVSLGTYASRVPALRVDNLPRTTFADPRWTWPWLRRAGILRGTRLASIGGMLDWMRLNLTHVLGGADTFGADEDIWGYRGYSPISKIVEGTVDSRNLSYGLRHWTEGCHGSTGFVSAALRVLNLPVRPIWVCAHEQIWFMSEDLYLDHADDPYNALVRASSSPSLLLLEDVSTWQGLFTTDLTVNITLSSGTPCNNVGHAALVFPP